LILFKLIFDDNKFNKYIHIFAKISFIVVAVDATAAVATAIVVVASFASVIE